MKRPILLIYLIALLLVIIASFFILRHSNQSPQPVEDNAIDSYILNANFTEYNEKGKIKLSMTADKITHMSGSGDTLFTKPRFIAYTDKDGTPVHIHADEGVSNKAGDKLILKNNVVVHELKTEAEPESTITTSELTVYPKKSIATTEMPVTIQRPGTIIHGTGFSANLKTGEYQLRSETSAVLQPKVLMDSKKKKH